MSDSSAHIAATLDMLFSEHQWSHEPDTSERWTGFWKKVHLLSDYYWGLWLDFCDELTGSFAFYQEWYRYHHH